MLLGAGGAECCLLLGFLSIRLDSAALAHRPLLDLFKLSQTDPAARTRDRRVFDSGRRSTGWVGGRAADSERQDAAAWLVVIFGIDRGACCCSWRIPSARPDLFDNIMHGRILGVYGRQSVPDTAAQFRGGQSTPSPPGNTTSAYGPAWEVLNGGTAWLVHQIVSFAPARVSVVANAVAFAVERRFAASTAVVVVILRRKAPERALAGVVLLAWNPVILVETLGNGHNDIAAIFWAWQPPGRWLAALRWRCWRWWSARWSNSCRS